jgi:hypothetical protein
VFTTHYAVPPNEEGFEDKEVKLFLGIAKEKIAKVPADFEHEIIEARWCKPDEAAKLLDRIEWKNVLDDAKDYLLSHF